MDHPDQKYIDALLNENSVLLRDIYKRFSGKIKGMILQHGGNEEDAKDIFQEALLSIFNRAKKDDFTLTCSFESFLYLICKRKWIKKAKKSNGLTVTIMNEAAFNIDDRTIELAEECLMHETLIKLIEQNVEKLGEKCKHLLYLSWNGKSMKEVADLLNTTHGFARKKKAGCMAKLIDLIYQSPEYKSLKW